MKITDVEAIVLRRHDPVRDISDGTQDTLVVRIHTDAGLVGIGEVDSAPEVVKAAIEAPKSHLTCAGFRQLLLGEDPRDVGRLWEKLYRGSLYFGRRGVGIHALSGIDIALWDLCGKALDQPVHRLLGGAHRDRVRAYASTLMPDTPAEAGREAERWASGGFTAVKLGWGGFGRSLDTDVALVEAARRAVGDRVTLMFDIGLVWDAATAIRQVQRMERFEPYWIEEPLMPDDLRGYRRLADAVDTRIACGEQSVTRWEFEQLLDEGRVDIIQPDIAHAGGLTETRRIAELARLRGVPLRAARLQDRNPEGGHPAPPGLAARGALPRVLRVELAARPGPRASRASGSTPTAWSPCPRDPDSASRSTSRCWSATGWPERAERGRPLPGRSDAVAGAGRASAGVAAAPARPVQVPHFARARTVHERDRHPRCGADHPPALPGGRVHRPRRARRPPRLRRPAGRSAPCACPPTGASSTSSPTRSGFTPVRVAVETVGGRVPVMGQSNHGSARRAAELARANEKAGASVISVALPRKLRLRRGRPPRIRPDGGAAVGVPLSSRTGTPAAPRSGAEFCARLRDACPNFRYVKLEEPRMGPKVRAIRARCGDAVGVLEGWVGEYMLELLPAGIVGVMPGLALVDVLQRVWDLGARRTRRRGIRALRPRSTRGSRTPSRAWSPTTTWRRTC